jgi:hypothetical protein
VGCLNDNEIKDIIEFLSKFAEILIDSVDKESSKPLAIV